MACDDLLIMLVVADEEACALHAPEAENIMGASQPYREAPERLTALLQRLREADASNGAEAEFEIVTRGDFGLEPILAVHDGAYVDWLKRVYNAWIEQGGDERGVINRISYHAAFAMGNTPDPAKLSLDGQIGLYSWDMGHTVAEFTFGAAHAAAQVAISAASWLKDVTSQGNPAPSIFAACRPPGHHASCSTTGGYCYLNNAAIAAKWLSRADAERPRVAILDLDAHHGNGTQQIFYSSAGVCYISLHAAHTFPHFSGGIEEQGSGEGLGFTHNFPLPIGTDEDTYMATLEAALKQLVSFTPHWLVVSLGVDTYEDDPFKLFKITKGGYNKLGRRIAKLRLPTLLVMEGGYSKALPDLFERFLSSFTAESRRATT